MATKDLSAQVAATYKMLRLGLAVMAFGLPPLLWIGGYLIGHLALAGSMSAYYHVSDAANPDASPFGQGVMRNELVGVLFGVSGILLVYQGYSKLEDYALNLAGVLAIGIALVPMPWPAVEGANPFTAHGAFAIAFFVSIAYVCIWRAGDTLPLVKDEAIRRRYQRIYSYLGWAMVVLPVMAFALLSRLPLYKSVTFVVEVAGIYVFAVYWVVKSHEASYTRVDEKAARGLVRSKPHGLRDALRSLPVDVDESNRR